MAEATIKFDRDRAGEYDLDIRKAIPGYEALHYMAQILLQNCLDESARLLIVGSGTGIELLNYSQENPNWALTGVDPSVEMMAIAKSELESKGLMKQVSLHTGYLDSLPEIETLDAATLLLVMHFLADDGSKLELLQNIAQRMKPGATLILADLYGDKSAPYFSQFIQAWQRFYFSRLDDEARAKIEPKFETLIENSIYFVPEARIIELLQMAGFEGISKFYNAFLFGGWIAQYAGN
ncbi:MAG: class I SAM-dependent methyltransferase [Cyanobacteria bacterium J06631_2]